MEIAKEQPFLPLTFKAVRAPLPRKHLQPLQEVIDKSSHLGEGSATGRVLLLILIVFIVWPSSNLFHLFCPCFVI
jgi:hypothetical protein